jgi:hypothetical protein
MKSTQFFLIYSCPMQADKDFVEQGKIYVGLRATYETVFEIAGSGSYARFGTDIQIIESLDGLQIQLFSIKYMPKYSLSMIEIIYNPKMEPRHQFIDLYTYYMDTLYSKNLTFSNTTSVSIGARDGYFLMQHSDQDSIVAFLSCDYQSYISGGGNSCRKCEGGDQTFQVSDYTCMSCQNAAIAPTYMAEKFDFVCDEEYDSQVYNPFILVFSVFGAILLTLMCCICIIVLRLKGLICHGRQTRQLYLEEQR